MKAVRFYGPRDIRVEEVPAPRPEAGGLLVRIEACAICGTDVKAFSKGNPRIEAPQTLGHEFVGEVVEVGAGCEAFALGERVTMATSISCGACTVCRAGHTNWCEQLQPVSYHYPGAFAEYLAIPAVGVNRGHVVKVPSGLGELAALAEPTSCAVNAQQLAGVGRGDTVVVVGYGPLGAIHAALARAYGAKRVIVTQRSAQRLAFARAAEVVDEVIDAGASDVVSEVKRLTDGRGADVVIVTAPDQTAQEQSIHLAAKGGRVNLFASLPQGASDIRLDSRIVHYRELFISGASDSTAAHVREAVRLLAEGAIPEQVITHRLGIDDFMSGIQLMLDKKSLKVLIRCR